MLFGSKRAYISKRKVFSKLESEDKELSNESDNSLSSVSENALEKFHSSDSEDEKSVPRKAPDIQPVVPEATIQQEQRLLGKRKRPIELTNNPACVKRLGSEKMEGVGSGLPRNFKPKVQQVQQVKQLHVQQKKGKRKAKRKANINSIKSGEEALKGIARPANISNIVCSSDEDEEEHVQLQQVQQANFSKAEKRIQEAAKKRGTLVFNEVVKNHEDKESKAKASSGKRYKQEVDTNILAFDMSVLKNEKDVFTGDPIFCKNCKAVLNNYSQITTFKGKKEQVWICEFCDNSNEIQIEPEDQPKKTEVTYILEPAPSKEEKKEELKVSEERKTIIFCVDVSGSMDTAQTIKIGENAPIEKLRELMRSMGYRYKDWKNKSSISLERLSCIKLALERQMVKLSKEAPNTEIGIVTFNSNVLFIGDGTSFPVKHYPSEFKNYKRLIENAQKNAKCLISNPVSVSKDKLIGRVRDLKTSGSTALGPGLAVALGAAFKAGPGSRIILCTDGEANQGPGSIGANKSSKDEAVKFYTEIGQMARKKGIVISLISIVGDSCRLDLMSSIAELTRGEILKVNPISLVSEFDSLISENIIATNVELKVKLHKGLSFRNEKKENLSEDGSLLIKSLGNITANEEVTVEYHTKSKKKLKILEIDFSKISSLPFQAQITYFTLSGAKCLYLITKRQDVTFEKEEAKKEADYTIVASNAIKQSSNLAREGQIKVSQAAAVHWKRMLKGTNAYEDYMVGMAPMYNALQQQNQGLAAAADWLVSESVQTAKWNSRAYQYPYQNAYYHFK